MQGNARAWNCLSVPLIRSLPSSLRTLIAKCDIDSVTLAATSLDAAGNQTTNIWPPNLESLYLSPTGLCTTSSASTLTLTRFLRSLPQTLTSLSLDVHELSHRNFAENAYSAGAPPLDASILPPRLTSLTLRILATVVGTFPTSLTFLESITQPSFPASLRSLNLYVSPHDKVPPLPSSLVTLTASYWSTEWFELIPKSVTFLHFESLGYINGAEDYFHVLPSALHTLKVKQFRSGSLDSARIDRFDFSSLINLKALVFPTLYSSNIPTLPRGLHTLKLKDTTTIPLKVTAELPQHLHCLEGMEFVMPKSRDDILELLQHLPPIAIACLPSAESLVRARLRDAF